MKLRTFLTAMVAMSFLFSTAQSPKPIKGQYIVVLKETVAKPVIKLQQKTSSRDSKIRAAKEIRDNNVAKIREVQQKLSITKSAVKAEYADVLCGFLANLSVEEVKQLKLNPNIQGVYQDFQIDLPELAIETPVDIEVYKQRIDCAVSNAGGPVNGSSKPTWIWIVDTGIAGAHPDLNVVDDTPYAIAIWEGESWYDRFGDGTLIAGVAAAKDNSIGVVGVSSGAWVVPVDVFNEYGTATLSSILAGLNHVSMLCIPNDVVALPIHIGPTENCESFCPAIRDAVLNLGNAGTWVVIAAGDEHDSAQRFFPGCINGDHVVTVSSVRCDQSYCNTSNWNWPGATPVIDWVATGVNVYSTVPPDKYKAVTGTDMAAAVVAGIIHARGGAPVQGGTITVGDVTYKISHR